MMILLYQHGIMVVQDGWPLMGAKVIVHNDSLIIVHQVKRKQLASIEPITTADVTWIVTGCNGELYNGPYGCNSYMVTMQRLCVTIIFVVITIAIASLVLLTNVTTVADKLPL